MSTLNADHLTLETAQGLLRRFICVERTGEAAPDNTLVRESLLLVANHSDYQIFGVCADTAVEAAATLRAYLSALSYEEMPEISAIEGPVYVKFNPKTGRCHTDPYSSVHRGVLVSCQSAYDGDVNETFGHLPLNLFGES